MILTESPVNETFMCTKKCGFLTLEVETADDVQVCQ